MRGTPPLSFFGTPEDALLDTDIARDVDDRLWRWRTVVLDRLHKLAALFLLPPLLFVLAGSRRETNLFYRLLQIIARPFTVPVRKLTPRQVADRHVPVVTFFLLAILYIVVTFEKIDHCIAVGMVGCR